MTWPLEALSEGIGQRDELLRSRYLEDMGSIRTASSPSIPKCLVFPVVSCPCPLPNGRSIVTVSALEGQKIKLVIAAYI